MKEKLRLTWGMAGLDMKNTRYPTVKNTYS